MEVQSEAHLINFSPGTCPIKPFDTFIISYRIEFSRRRLSSSTTCNVSYIMTRVTSFFVSGIITFTLVDHDDDNAVAAHHSCHRYINRRFFNIIDIRLTVCASPNCYSYQLPQLFIFRYSDCCIYLGDIRSDAFHHQDKGTHS